MLSRAIGTADGCARTPRVGSGPEIPPTEPPKGPDRTRFLVGLAKWLGRNKNLAGKLLEGSIRATDWLNDKRDLIEAAKEPPRPLDVLQDLSRFEKPGYDRHHVVEKTSAQYWGFAKDDTERPDNIVVIPRLKHWQITGWFMTRNEEFGWLSPRDYLADKGWEERRRVGLYALRKFEVLEP